jgi:hypothetical protein
MLATMSKKKTGRPKSATPPKEKILAMRMPDDLFEALEAYRQSQTYVPDRTAVGLRALENLLRAEGFYPPRKP